MIETRYAGSPSNPASQLMILAVARAQLSASIVRRLAVKPHLRGNVRYRVRLLGLAAVLVGGNLIACGKPETSGARSDERPAVRGEGFVLQIDEGERRVRRNAGKGPFILKVDRQNGGSPDLVMGYEELAPGAEIQLHRHLVADEIVFVHRGSGVASLNGRQSPVRAGATIFIPRGVTIGLVNTDTMPLGIAFVFSKPGFEELMRDNSVLEGQPVTLMTPDERARIQARHKWHTIAGPRP